MTQTLMTLRPNRIDRLEEVSSEWSTVSRDRTIELLNFPLEAMGMLTQFRENALSYIFRTALELSEGQLESAAVSVSSTPDEEDSLNLDLTLTLNTDWNVIQRLRHEILIKVGEWSQEWSQEEQEDYGRRIFFGLVPSQL